MDLCQPVIKLKKKKNKNKKTIKPSHIIELIPIEIDNFVYLINIETQSLYQLDGTLIGVYPIND